MAVLIGAHRFFMTQADDAIQAALLAALDQLKAFQDQDMIDDLMNAPNKQLVERAQRWTKDHGYMFATDARGWKTIFTP